MIEFISLFLGGLLTGPQTVEFMTGDPVAIVEVWLDGELEERLQQPPWKLELDLGDQLFPHLLEGVALDTTGRELDRTRQWINISPKEAQSSVLIEGADRGRGAVARVSWESLAEIGDPTLVEAIFDGHQIAVEDSRAIQLPDFDPRETHYLRVRLEFTEQLYSEAESVFGGAYGSAVSTEISAVPIRSSQAKKVLSPASMEGWLTVEGAPQKIHAIEQGLAEIVVVRDMAARPLLMKMAQKVGRIDIDIRLRRNFRLSSVNACPRAHERDGSQRLLFPRTQRYAAQDGTVLRLLATVSATDCTEDRQQLTNALAVAGLTASEDGLRRIVLLILGPDPQDRSELAPDQVVAYLRALRVPLVVWSLNSTESPDTPWGPAIDVRKLRRLVKAYDLIEKELEHQQIVWIEGLHLPQAVGLRPGVEDISLVD